MLPYAFGHKDEQLHNFMHEVIAIFWVTSARRHIAPENMSFWLKPLLGPGNCSPPIRHYLAAVPHYNGVNVY